MAEILKPVTHELKTWPIHFQDIHSGNKKVDVRKNDRNYKVDDYLHLKEYVPKFKKKESTDIVLENEGRAYSGSGKFSNTKERLLSVQIESGEYTGREMTFRVSHLLSGVEFGIMEGYVVMSLVDIEEDLEKGVVESTEY